jgi:F0F1-type ATP synthase delta subunit
VQHEINEQVDEMKSIVNENEQLKRSVSNWENKFKDLESILKEKKEQKNSEKELRTCIIKKMLEHGRNNDKGFEEIQFSCFGIV